MRKVIGHLSLVICFVLAAAGVALSDSPTVRISDLPSASALSGDELVVGVQSGTTRKITVDQIVALLSGTGYAVAWANVTGRPLVITALEAAGPPSANTVPLFSGTATAGYLSVPLFSQTMISTGTNAAAVRSTIGLGNVDNTGDLDKPVSTATQTALDGKIAVESGTATNLTLTGTLSGNITRAGTTTGGSIDTDSLSVGGTPVGNAIFSHEEDFVPSTPDAISDCVAYAKRISTYDPETNGANAKAPTDMEGLARLIDQVYASAGKSALVDAWFTGSAHNVISGTVVPAFSSTANNGVSVNGPVAGAESMTFTSSSSQYVRLPTSLNTELASFTVFVAAKQSGDGVSRGAWGNRTTQSGNSVGFEMRDVWSSTAVSSNVGYLWGDDSGTAGAQTLAKPMGPDWQTIAISFESGSQKLYVNGRLFLTSSSTVAIGTTNTQLTIGAAGLRTDTTTLQSPFNGEIAATLLFSGVLSEPKIQAISSALRRYTSPGNGEINIVCEGDSITGGMTFAGGQYAYDAAGYPDYMWPQILMARSNWSGKAAQFRVGKGGDTVTNINASAQFAVEALPWRPRFQRAYSFIWAGTNDVLYDSGAATAVDVYDKLKIYWAQARAAGFSVVAFCILDRNDVSVAKRTRIQDINTLIRSDSSLYDYLIDLYDEISVGSIYTDGVHPTYPDGEDLIADEINTVISNP